jgi:hypothetical protein
MQVLETITYEGRVFEAAWEIGPYSGTITIVASDKATAETLFLEWIKQEMAKPKYQEVLKNFYQ